jgi:uncharacterized protein
VKIAFENHRINLERTSNRASRRKGLLGRTSLDGLFLLERCRMVHTVGMKFSIDVAYGKLQGHVSEPKIEIVGTHTMKPNRFGLPRFRANCVLEAEAGSFQRWSLIPGQVWAVTSDAESNNLVANP